MITVVVGAQYGGEGKGKVCSFLGAVGRHKFVCRAGGVNSSHTVKYRGRTERLRMLPASAMVRESTCVYGAGSLIHIPTLLKEARRLSVSLDRIVIDPRAGIVTNTCIAEQRADEAYSNIGSTLTGTGYASARRCMRRLPLAADFPELARTMGDVPALVHDAVSAGENVLIEGHQGAGLSNYHGDYPFTSSRDCTAAAMLSEVGIGPRVELEVVLIVKVFPTRNHAGRLPGEMSENEAAKLGIFEEGGGSWGIADKRRRVGRLSLEDVERAIILNTPSYIALTGFDYAFPETRGANSASALSASASQYIRALEQRLKVPVGLVSTGPEVESTIGLLPHLVDANVCDDRAWPERLTA